VASIPRPSHLQKLYSTKPAAEEPTQEPAAAATGESGASPATPDANAELNAKLDQQSKTIAELKVTNTLSPSFILSRMLELISNGITGRKIENFGRF